MKILYLVHQFYPMHYTGTEKFLLNLTTAMQRWGHKVKVLTYSFYEESFYDGGSNGIATKEFMYKGIQVKAFQQKKPPDDLHYGMENPSLITFAEEVLRQEQPDVVHIAHGMRMTEFVMAASRLGIPYVVTMTDFFLMCPKCILFTSGGALCSGPQNGEECKRSCPEFGAEMIQRRLKVGTSILQKATRVVAPSRFLGTLFKTELPFLEPRVIPYGIDFSRIKLNKRSYDGKGEFVLLYAGQVDYHKGVHVLIDAFTRVKAENAVLKIYGSGPDAATQHFKEMAKSDKRIEFCGVYKEDQVGEIFSGADAVVIPSNWHENNTIVMREALASHVPCIVSNAGGMIEKIQDGVNGLVFRMGDVMHLKETLEKALQKPELLQSMKKNLTGTALTTVEQEAFAYEQEYQRIANAR